MLANPAYIAAGFLKLESEEDAKNSKKQIAEIGQAGLFLSDRDYYLLNDEHTTKVRSQCQTYVGTIFALIGDSPKQAEVEAHALLAVATKLAQGSMLRVDMRTQTVRTTS